MPQIKSRKPFSPSNPYRKVRPSTSKIIFLSLEGSVTEEQYFNMISEMFDDIKTKVQFISVAEDAVNTCYKFRTEEQKRELSKCRPKQLLGRLEKFKLENEKKYEFSKYPQDEFWIVTDIDNNTSPELIGEWDYTVNECEKNGYGYAISNPFFEIWLLLHHVDANDVDKSYAVTENNPYRPTNHFRNRLREDAKAPLKEQKKIFKGDYTPEKVMDAIERAKNLHIDKLDKCPKYFATTVYKLLENIKEMIPK